MQNNPANTHTHTQVRRREEQQPLIIKRRASTHSSGFLVDLHVKPEIETKSDFIRHQQKPADDKHKSLVENKQNQEN